MLKNQFYHVKVLLKRLYLNVTQQEFIIDSKVKNTTYETASYINPGSHERIKIFTF